MSERDIGLMNKGDFDRKLLNRKSATVMIIDDEPNIHDAFELILQEKYNIVCFDSGWDGCSYIKKHKVDLVFVDHYMPEVSGLETAIMIKRQDPLIPVVMVTGRSSEEVAIGALRAGIEDYVTKPFSREEIENVAANFISEAVDPVYGKLEIAKNVIETEFANSYFQLCNAATAAGLNTNYLSGRFKQCYGISPVQYIIKLRVNKAKQLLENTNLTIAQISHNSGFNHHSYFCRLFCRITGLSPRAYRKAHITESHN